MSSFSLSVLNIPKLSWKKSCHFFFDSIFLFFNCFNFLSFSFFFIVRACSRTITKFAFSLSVLNIPKRSWKNLCSLRLNSNFSFLNCSTFLSSSIFLIAKNFSFAILKFSFSLLVLNIPKLS